MGRWLAGIALLLGLALVGYGIFGRQTDEEKIRAQLERLASAVRTNEETGQNPIVRGANLRGTFSELFEKEVSYRIPELTSGTSGRESLVQLATRATSTLTTFDVTFKDVAVRFEGGGTVASVETVAKVSAFRGSERYEEDERNVHFDFVNAEGDWKISSFRVQPKE